MGFGQDSGRDKMMTKILLAANNWVEMGRKRDTGDL
jgi:hypothetical protein